MKILVFGGSGFLGSHIADALTDVGHDVTIYDIKPSPYIKDKQKIVQGDILNQDLVEEVVSKNEIVYHMAGIADLDECLYRPIDTVKYNILGTVQILEACHKSKIKRFIFASSAYVYSDKGYFYRNSKQVCELFIENYQELYGLSYTILRYGSLYGERSDSRNSIYKIVKQALSEGKISYKGSGDEFREFINVKDAAQNSVRILEPEFENENVILTGHQSIKYFDLLRMIKEMLGNKIDIELVSSERKAHYKLSPYSFSPKLGKKLICNPHIDIGQGLLLLMEEIYEKLHVEKHKELGFIVDNKDL